MQQKSKKVQHKKGNSLTKLLNTRVVRSGFQKKVFLPYRSKIFKLKIAHPGVGNKSF